MRLKMLKVQNFETEQRNFTEPLGNKFFLQKYVIIILITANSHKSTWIEIYAIGMKAVRTQYVRNVVQLSVCGYTVILWHSQ